jgi:hypothetical protein
MKEKPLLQKKWESGATREFYLADHIHDESIVTSVFGVGFYQDKGNNTNFFSFHSCIELELILSSYIFT